MGKLLDVDLSFYNSLVNPMMPETLGWILTQNSFG